MEADIVRVYQLLGILVALSTLIGIVVGSVRRKTKKETDRDRTLESLCEHTSKNTLSLDSLKAAATESAQQQALTNQGLTLHIEYCEKKDRSNEKEFEALWDKKADR